MKVFLEGWNEFQICGIEEGELRSLLKMIEGASLLERRTFEGLKKQIELLLSRK